MIFQRGALSLLIVARNRGTAPRRLHRQVGRGQAEIANGAAIILMVRRELQDDAAEGQHRSGLRPRLIHGNEQGPESLELRRHLPCGHEIRPRGHFVQRLKLPRKMGYLQHAFGSIIKRLGSGP